MWNILILDEPSDSQDILSKVNVANLIDMLYEDWESKNSVQAVQIQAVEPKNFSNADILEILKTINRECFKLVPNFEVSVQEVEKGT